MSDKTELEDGSESSNERGVETAVEVGNQQMPATSPPWLSVGSLLLSLATFLMLLIVIFKPNADPAAIMDLKAMIPAPMIPAPMIPAPMIPKTLLLKTTDLTTSVRIVTIFPWRARG